MPTPVVRPSNYPLPFANAGTKNTIPTPATGTGKASFTEGFPAVTMMPITAGGIPPEGKDFNGILFDITTHTVWVNAGGQYQFDTALSTEIGGYPAGMVLQNDAGTASYVSAVDNNTTDFNATPSSIGTLWLPYSGHAFSNVPIVTTGGTTALTAVQASADFITVTGALVSNATLTVPDALGQWAVINSTTGAYTLTVKTAAGTGVTVKQGRNEVVACDAVNVFYTPTLGALAREDIGQGLEDDGAGNLRVKLADSSLRRSASGVQQSQPISYVNTPQTLADTDNGLEYTLTGDTTFTAPLTSSLWNGYAVSIVARDGVATFTPNAADKVNNGTVGASYTLAQGQSATFTCDGAGNWQPAAVTVGPGGFYPRYLAANITVGPGTYDTDTTAAAFTVTLPAGPTLGDSVTLADVFGTWGANNLTVGRNGKNIQGLAENLVCNVPGQVIRLVYNGSEWRLQ